MNWVERILQRGTIQAVMGAIALYLGYQIWLNARYYGTDWPCWDYMLISGFLAFLLAIGLALDLNRRLDTAIEGLRLNNALILTDDGVTRLKLAMTARGKRIQVVSGLAMGVLIFGCYIWVFGELTIQIWQLLRQGALPEGGSALVELAVFTAISALAAALAGLFFGRLTHFGTLASVLSSNDVQLRIVPGHFDGASGLKPIGDFYLFQALLLAIPILWLGAWWAWVIPSYKDVICSVTGQRQFLFAEWQGPFFVQWLVVVGYFFAGFVWPFLTLRKRIRAAKAILTSEQAPKLEREIIALQRPLASSEDGSSSSVLDDIDHRALRLWSIRSMTDWPMDASTAAKYRSLVLGEVLMPLAAAVLSDGNRNSPVFQWLTSLLR